jgi:tetratricopeptide (TPR) repeat protein
MKKIILSSLLIGSLYAVSGEKSMTSKHYKALEEITNLMQSGENKKAFEKLDILKNKTHEKANYNLAFLYQSYAYFYIENEQYADAIKSYTKALSYKIFPKDLETTIHFTLAKLALSIEDYNTSIKWLLVWEKEVKTLTKEGMYMLGISYLQLDNYEKAIRPLKEAIALNSEVNLLWYKMLLTSYYAVDKQKEVKILLEKLLHLFPNEVMFWNRYLAIFLEKEAHQESLNILELMRANGILTEQRDWLTYIRLHLFLGTPLKAANTLNTLLEEKTLEQKTEMYTLLFNAFHNAKEHKKALDALSRAVEISKDEKLTKDLMMLYLDDENYTKVINLSQKIIYSERSEVRAYALLYQGIAYYHQKAFILAEKSFSKAIGLNEVKESAKRWLLMCKER